MKLWNLIKLLWRNIQGEDKLQNAINHLAVSSITKFAMHSGQSECDALNIMWNLKTELIYERNQAIREMAGIQ